MNGADAAKVARPGDVLLFHRPITWVGFRQDKMGTLMCLLIHLTTRSRFNHAALALGEGKMVEAVARGVSITDISSTADDVTLVSTPYEDEDDRFDAMAWGSARAGVRYGYWNAFLCGFNSVVVGLHLVIKKTDAIICSELVSEALEHAGFDFGDKDTAEISPGDLATFFGVPRT